MKRLNVVSARRQPHFANALKKLPQISSPKWVI
jgi:hypothetical protein